MLKKTLIDEHEEMIDVSEKSAILYGVSWTAVLACDECGISDLAYVIDGDPDKWGINVKIGGGVLQYRIA
jgi:hypothetical protein